ncbi:Uncharacterized protein T09_11270, partial [Trichinella sp. T9]
LRTILPILNIFNRRHALRLSHIFPNSTKVQCMMSVNLDSGEPPLKKFQPTKVKRRRVAIREKLQCEAMVESPPYFTENGLRKVRPYWFHYYVFAKKRWFGRRLVDVLQNELYNPIGNFFEEAILAGRVTVNGQPTSVDYVVENGDLIRHMCHRHELPVLDSAVDIVTDTEDILVVNKPCSIPVHPCGRYHFNSLVLYLKHIGGMDNLKTFHRLDRLTSGLVIFLKNEKIEKKLRQQMIENQIKKEYLCLVDGEFPEEEVVCDKPLDVLSQSMGIMYITDDGKPSLTKFYKLFSDGKTSILKCCPETGRTHQIRVHLQYLGYPIVNDYVYNNSDAFGPNKGKLCDYGKSLDELREVVKTCFTAEKWIDRKSTVDPTKFENCSWFNVECHFCCTKFLDPKPSDLEMYLHCFRYSGLEWSYETPLPKWAQILKETNIHI